MIYPLSQHKIPFIAKLPHANLSATDKKRHFRALFQLHFAINFSTKNHDITDERRKSAQTVCMNGIGLKMRNVCGDETIFLL